MKARMMIVMMMMICASLIMFAPTSSWAITPVVFNVGSATTATYSTFQTSLRDTAKDAKLKCYGIPMLPSTSQEPKYLLVTLRNNQAKTITLMLRRNNLYVMGYSDPFETNKCRYHIFKDVTGTERQVTETTLCPDPKTRVKKDINYDSRYPSLEGKAGVKSRKQVLLGINVLNSKIGKISGITTFTEKTEAELLLVAIQMVSEAARFKYIENQVITNFEVDFNPNDKVIELEENWGKISTAIHGAKNGVLPKSLDLKGEKGDKWTVSTVAEIKPDISLLNYVSGSCQVTNTNPMFLFPRPIMSYFYYDDGANVGGILAY